MYTTISRAINLIIHPVAVSISCISSSGEKADTTNEEQNYYYADDDADQCSVHRNSSEELRIIYDR